MSMCVNDSMLLHINSFFPNKTCEIILAIANKVVDTQLKMFFFMFEIEPSNFGIYGFMGMLR